MQSKPFVIVAAIVCAVMVLICIPMGLKFWGVFRTRRAFNTAVEAYNDGKYDKALPLLDDALKTLPHKTVLYKLAAYTCTRLPTPDYDRARGYYEGLVERAEEDEDKVLAHTQLGGIYLRSEGRDLDKAIEHLEAALGIDEDIGQAHAALGIAYMLKKLPSRAAEHLERGWNAYLEEREGQIGPAARLWTISGMLEQGEIVEASAAYKAVMEAAPDMSHGHNLGKLATARAFRANDDGISTSIREFYLQGVSLVPGEEIKKHGLILYTLAAAAHERLGHSAEALKHSRQALGAAPKDAVARRNLAFALFKAAEGTKDDGDRGRLMTECLALYRKMLDDQQLAGDERKQVTLALASIVWNAGKKAEAEALIKGIGSSSVSLIHRMQAANAIREQDYRKAIGHLQKALESDPKQPDVAALVQRLQAPPLIREFRVNSQNPYDNRPLISVAYLPQALPELIPPSRVRLTLDGETVTPVFAKSECFFQPEKPLEQGEHKLEIRVTDTLGLTSAKTLAFSIRQDNEGPVVVGMTPEPNGTAEENPPIIAFRATDPSGIVSQSMSATMSRAGGGSMDIISKGRYKFDLPKQRIKKGDPVPLGSVKFKFPKALRPSEYTISVGVSDAHGNRALRKWSFKVQ